MINEALDFKAESNAIAGLLKPLNVTDYDTITQFKDWTIFDVLAHLHLWNLVAFWTLTDEPKYLEIMTRAIEVFQGGKTHQDMHRQWAADNGFETGQQLYAAWTETYAALAKAYHRTEPDLRVKWAGLEMNARSAIIARQMEAWAHSQAIYDILSKDREDGDRLKNVAHIGVTTYSWSFKVKGQAPILPKPYVRLTAPSGDIWEWNDPQEDNRVEGTATEFSQVVTQCRNIADTKLKMTGEAATAWMGMAQCFAGSPETPPAPNTRYKV
ncbi:TIGR03084 family metal-binding protein [Hellea balneolensis]|uniref:TIGR03084 family metal-binding protein n=1 Tax=Hellea balneolensis TaxID=287478 RepID=UPI000419D5EF|nr:TIGR03084 family metal-binding protein [Hellea balneolensis]